MKFVVCFSLALLLSTPASAFDGVGVYLRTSFQKNGRPAASYEMDLICPQRISVEEKTSFDGIDVDLAIFNLDLRWPAPLNWFVDGEVPGDIRDPEPPKVCGKITRTTALRDRLEKRGNYFDILTSLPVFRPEYRHTKFLLIYHPESQTLEYKFASKKYPLAFYDKESCLYSKAPNQDKH